MVELNCSIKDLESIQVGHFGVLTLWRMRTHSAIADSLIGRDLVLHNKLSGINPSLAKVSEHARRSFRWCLKGLVVPQLELGHELLLGLVNRHLDLGYLVLAVP